MARVPIPEDDPAPQDPLLDTLWNRVLEAWEDDRPHAALLDHALRVHALPEIAGRYRTLVEDEGKGPAAQKRLDAIVLAATNMLWATKMPVPGKVPAPILLSAFGVSALLLSWLAWTLWGH